MKILLTFTNVSDYVNNILQAYSAYKFVFKSIGKAHFDHVCRLIQPEQVISLTLCDDEDTPGQSQLFFSHYHIKQFTQLRSLTLTKIEPKTLKFIIFHLSKLKLLRSFFLDYNTAKCANANQFFYMEDLLLKKYPPVASRLHRLYLHSGRILILTPSHPYLCYLKLNTCSSDELETIFHHTSQLQSLEVDLKIHEWNFKLSLPPNRLVRLVLEIKNYRISMTEAEQFLIQLPYLKHLELKTIGMMNLVNGYQWEKLVKDLRTFNFKFLIEHTLTKDILQSFRGHFWLKEKRWFVACQSNRLFSVPRFLPNQMDISQQCDIYTTASDHSFFSKHIKTILVGTSPIRLKYNFSGVEMVYLQHHLSLRILTSILNLNQVKHLTLLAINHLIGFVPLESNFPQLCELAIKESVTIEKIEGIRTYQFEQIRKLEISLTNQFHDYIMEELFHLFPSVQDFLHTSSIQSEETMFRCIDGFKRLAHASFHVDPMLDDDLWEWYDRIDCYIEYPRMLRTTNFTYRIFKSSDPIAKHSIHWWIGEQPIPTFLKAYWPSRREYHWQRLKYLCFTSPYLEVSSIKYIVFFMIRFLAFFLFYIELKTFFFFCYNFLK